MRCVSVTWSLLAVLAGNGWAQTTQPAKTSGEFELVRDGRPVAAIVLGRELTRSARFAARELQEHVRRITGAELPIVADDAKIEGARILVGECTSAEAMGLWPERFGPQEYVIVLRPETLVLYGKDDPNRPSDTRAPSLPPELFGSSGTLYAVYHFLERSCGVRWYAPGEIGLVHPRTNTLVVNVENLRRAPAMVHRWITPTPLYMPGPPTEIPASDVHLWKLRMRIGGKDFWVCHSFDGYYDRFLKDHPDWFAQGYEGKPPQMCYTNPEFIDQVVADARAYFDGKGVAPGATARGNVYGLVPMDNNRWCKCPRCRAEMDPAEQANQQFNNGKASDYIFGFVNWVAAEIRKSHPDKWIGALAYSDYAYYPTKAPVMSNVVVQLCLHTRNWWCPSMEANDRRMLEEWRSRDPRRPLYLWLYYNFPALNAKYDKYGYFPGFFARTVVSQMDLYRKANIQGVFMEHSSEFGATYLMDQLEFYVTLKLADDPTLDGRQLIDEFFEKYYGHAGPAMRKVYEAIEDVFSDPRKYPPEIQESQSHQHQNERLAWEWLGTAERMERIGTLVADAVRAARTEIEKKRVEMFVTGIWETMQQGRRQVLERSRSASKPGS